MGYDVKLVDALEGSNIDLSVTYNYCKTFRNIFPTRGGFRAGIYTLDGLKAVDSLPNLTKAINKLEDFRIRGFPIDVEIIRYMDKLMKFATENPTFRWRITW